MAVLETLSIDPAVSRRGAYVSGFTFAALSVVLVIWALPSAGWSVGVVLIVTMAAFTAATVAYGFQFKQVGILDRCLVVSDRKRTAHIPVGDILSVSRTARTGWSPTHSPPDIVLLVLREKSIFGRRISFITSEYTPFFSSSENPIVIRLRELSKQHTAEKCPHNVSAQVSRTGGAARA